MKIEEGFWAREKNSPLLTLLEGWSDATKKYCKCLDGTEAPFFFNERANVSILAAGAWLKKGIAIEEYQSIKNREEEQRNGRCDLYVCVDGKGFELETKALLRPMPESEEKFRKKICLTLDKAVADANCLTGFQGIRRAGCAFFTMRVFASKHTRTDFLQEQYEAEIERFHGVLKSNDLCDAFAWCAPEIIRRLRTGGAKDAFLFGSVVAIKLVDTD